MIQLMKDTLFLNLFHENSPQQSRRGKNIKHPNQQTTSNPSQTHRSYLQLVSLFYNVNPQNPIRFLLLQITDILRYLNDFKLRDLTPIKAFETKSNSMKKRIPSTINLNWRRTQMIKSPSWERSGLVSSPLGGTTALPAFHRPGI